jgi:hypothetical protein
VSVTVERTQALVDADFAAMVAELDVAPPALALIVCGSRHWTARRPITTRLDQLWDAHPELTVLEGGARGADRIAGQWAAPRRMHGVAWVRFDARWDDYPLGQRWRAGHDRNQDMLDYLLATTGEKMVLAFKSDFDWTLAKGGTEDMVRRAKEAGVRGVVVRR